MDDVIRRPGLGPVIGSQVRYQLTLMLRTPRTLMAGLILPGALLATAAGPGRAGRPGRRRGRARGAGTPAWWCWAR